MENSGLILGEGITFPFNLINGKVAVDSSNVCIASSIVNILGWPTGDRLFQNHFGSKLFHLLSEPNDEITATLAKHFIIDALELHEKRIRLLDVKFSIEKAHELTIVLIYELLSTGKVMTLPLTITNL